MDPLAHSFVGASLAETGLKRLTPLGTTALIVSANAADIDALTYFLDTDVSLGFRRGITHGVIALVVLPVLIASLLYGLDRWRRASSTPARFGPLLALSALGALTHPFFDWINSYGIRLLMPFSGTWFYGDAMFVVDPWFWLVAGLAPFVLWTRHRPGTVLWATLVLVMTVAMFVAPPVSSAARVAWFAGLAVWAALRMLVRTDGLWPQALAGTALAALAVYVVSMAALGRHAERRADEWLAERGVRGSTVALPVPVDPLIRDIVVDTGTEYRFLTFDGRDASIREARTTLAKGREDDIVRAALAQPSVAGLRHWLRFPSYQVEPRASGYRVIIRDARFWRTDGPGRGLGIAVVDVPDDTRASPPDAVSEQ